MLPEYTRYSGTQIMRQQRPRALLVTTARLLALAGPNILIAVDLSGPLPCSLIGADLCPIVPVASRPRFVKSKLPRCSWELKTSTKLGQNSFFVIPPTLLGVG